MEKKEINRYRPEFHDCDECYICQWSILNNSDNKCSACNFRFFKKLYKDFSSGNEEVDEIIKNPIYIPPNNFSKKYNGILNYYEWIPWERLSNIKEIARGGFGIICIATLIDGVINKYTIKHHGEMEYKRGRIGTEVAIKVIKTNSSEVFKELNIQRVMFMNSGNYSNSISSIFGITQNATTLEYGIVMKFTKHEDIRKYISTNFHSMSWSVKLVIAYRVARGLESIHRSGMVNRDLHSGNILQYDEQWVDIGDLGLCQPVNNKATTTEEKKIYGVIPYISPEVLRGENFTTAGDIYSYGMLLWELATGKPPFHDRSHDHILIMAILNGQRPKITSPLIPTSIAKIIKKCWDVNPKNRPTAIEVFNMLGKLLYTISKFKESDKYVKNMLKNDSTTKPLRRFSKYIQFLKKAKKSDEIAKPSTTTKINIHPGAVYTSRLLTAQMVDFSKG
ncbi:hypothetical protein G9A89_003528 [Geosiphon pyriformis]|nr:hypothetical protein G9A89_003528 [Geosiphon pyriformis]